MTDLDRLIIEMIVQFEKEYSGETYDHTKEQTLRELLDEIIPNISHSLKAKLEEKLKHDNCSMYYCVYNQELEQEIKNLKDSMREADMIIESKEKREYELKQKTQKIEELMKNSDKYEGEPYYSQIEQILEEKL